MTLYAEDRIRDLEESNEELHGEVLELKRRADMLEAEKEATASELDSAIDERDTALSDVTDVERELDRLDALIKSALDDLRALSEVPLRDLEESITNVVVKLGER